AGTSPTRIGGAPSWMGAIAAGPRCSTDPRERRLADSARRADSLKSRAPNGRAAALRNKTRPRSASTGAVSIVLRHSAFSRAVLHGPRDVWNSFTRAAAVQMQLDVAL